VSKIRVTVFIDPESDPELYQELEALPGRVRATRLKSLSLVGLLLSKTAKPPSSTSEAPRKAGIEPDSEDSNRKRKHQAARKLVGSLD